MVNKESVGNAIAMQRKEKGFTQKEFAEKLHVSCQAVSKWELGKSLPTLELINDMSAILGVTVDYLLNAEKVNSRDICYMDTGLDTISLYDLKARLDELTSKDGNILYRHYVRPVFYKTELKEMDKPLYVMNTFVPGSKARLAKEYGKDEEIGKDLVAKAINNLLAYGVTPLIFQAHLVCGNKSNEQITRMAVAMQETCKEQGVDFGGLEISAQPINYLPDEYELSAALTGVVDEKNILKGNRIEEGDVMIAIETEGIDSTSIPFIRVMLERNRALALEKIDGEHVFIDEALKANKAHRWELENMRTSGILHGAFNVSNSFSTSACAYDRIPEDLNPCINMSNVKIRPIYAFLHHLDMVGDRYFPARFALGVNMIVVVPANKTDEALKIIHETGSGYVIGKIEKSKAEYKREGCDDYIHLEGRIQWK